MLIQDARTITFCILFCSIVGGSVGFQLGFQEMESINFPPTIFFTCLYIVCYAISAASKENLNIFLAIVIGFVCGYLLGIFLSVGFAILWTSVYESLFFLSRIFRNSR